MKYIFKNIFGGVLILLKLFTTILFTDLYKIIKSLCLKKPENNITLNQKN
jgi:hypothetical protein